MKNLYFFLACILPLFAQNGEALMPISAYNHAQKNTTKEFIIDGEWVIMEDTLSLPVFDDFSTDKFYDPSLDPSSPNVTQEVYFRLNINELTPDAVDAMYALDTTYNIQYDSISGNQVVSRTPLASVIRKIAQVNVYPVTFVDQEFWPVADVIDTLWNPTDIQDFDTVLPSQRIEQNSYNRYILGADPSKIWMDREVWRNASMAENPPSIFTATFDALDASGKAYSNAPNAYGQADVLTSKPIDLNVANANSSYLSFYYQCVGLSGDASVDENDSLVLAFYAPDLDEWEVVWSQKFIGNAPFELAMVPVDDPKWYKEGFRFKFYNYATLNGMHDQWHIDYVYLNNNRNQNDTIFDDLAMVYEAPSILLDYTAMPWKHYKNAPNQYMIPSVEIPFVNNDDQGKILVDLQYRITNKDVPTHIENIGGGVVGNIGAESQMTEVYKIKDAFNYQFDTSIDADSCPTFKVDFIVKTSTPNDTLLTNDTCSFYQRFEDYYAYNDGSAEAGYGVYSDLGFPEIAVEYQTPFADTLKAIDIYFAQTQEVVEENVKFRLAVWRDLDNPFNPDPLFPDEYDFPMYIAQDDMPAYEVIYGGREDGFVRYYLPEHVEVNGTFFIGIINATDGERIPIGIDLKRDFSQKTYYRLNVFQGAFSQSSIDGALMIRPVFKLAKDPLNVSVKENNITEVKMYPNPSEGILRFNFEAHHQYQIQIFNQQGVLMLNETLTQELNLSSFVKGLYFVSLQDEQGNVQYEKLILN